MTVSGVAWVETLRYAPPPEGVLAYRAGLRCGSGHPGEIIEAETFRALERRERAWRCTMCGQPDVHDFSAQRLKEWRRR